MKPNETCQLVEMKNAFASKGDQMGMYSRKNYFMDTILGADFLHVPVPVVLGKYSDLQKLKKTYCPNIFTSSGKAVQI